MKTINFCDYEWYVLEEQGNKMLLLVKDIITKKTYHEKYEGTSWEKCTLRKWLNSDFYQTLEKCHANILETETELDVMDKIFLLSVEEVEQYDIPPAEGWWWLRSPDNFGTGVADVGGEGGILIYGSGVYNAFGGVRPAMWVDTK
ncbi:MAG: DUF6273 domain-containing protein [Defluviitaleaceae bacterium]|nr:DUF6273 domain-containing protein [Defluviitaleaceae bacterium]